MNFRLFTLVVVAMLLVIRGSYSTKSSFPESFLQVAKRGNLDRVEGWIQKGADINCVNFNGETALMHAAMGGNFAIVQLLITKGADVNHGDRDRKNALMIAMGYGEETIARFLIEHGANVNIGDNEDVPRSGMQLKRVMSTLFDC
jgi:ankyrin repeat protein